MTNTPRDKKNEEEQVAKERDEVLLRMLKTPPKQHKDMVGGGKKLVTEADHDEKQGDPTAKRDHPEN